MVPGKKQVKQKIGDEINELENLLGAVLAPVAPRGEFVYQLQNRLESRFDPKPILIIPSKFINYIVIGVTGLLGGIILTIVGVKWIKRIMKSKWDMREIKQKNTKANEPQIPAVL